MSHSLKQELLDQAQEIMRLIEQLRISEERSSSNANRIAVIEQRQSKEVDALKSEASRLKEELVDSQGIECEMVLAVSNASKIIGAIDATMAMCEKCAVEITGHFEADVVELVRENYKGRYNIRVFKSDDATIFQAVTIQGK